MGTIHLPFSTSLQMFPRTWNPRVPSSNTPEWDTLQFFNQRMNSLVLDPASADNNELCHLASTLKDLCRRGRLGAEDAYGHHVYLSETMKQRVLDPSQPSVDAYSIALAFIPYARGWYSTNIRIAAMSRLEEIILANILREGHVSQNELNWASSLAENYLRGKCECTWQLAKVQEEINFQRSSWLRSGEFNLHEPLQNFQVEQASNIRWREHHDVRPLKS
jgi:hypothetical protein